MDHRIRKAREADLATVGKLAGQLVRMHHAWDPQRWMRPSGIEEGYARFFAGQLDDPDTIILVAEDTLGDVVGYAYAALEPRSWADLREACGKLHDVFVATHARRRGIGKALTREAMARLRDLGAPRAVLTSAWQNHEAHALFRSLGFRETMLEMAKELDRDVETGAEKDPEN
jgi:ribosomal protein S18 acetylase RimI-like enzyme